MSTAKCTADGQELAKLFHETYERLAPSFGYTTRRESAKPWKEVPDANRRLMAATCSEVMADYQAKCLEVDRLTKALENLLAFHPHSGLCYAKRTDGTQWGCVCPIFVHEARKALLPPPATGIPEEADATEAARKDK